MPATVSIVMPAYNAAHLLDRSLTAAMAAADGRSVIVVDPGSTDDTSDVARGLGAEVIRLDKRAGPAHARNVGVERVDTEVVLFIDSDCVAHPDVVDRVAAAFEDPELVSLTGSYDDTPPEQNFFSLYMNLRHHFTHQRANTEDATFWAGCGAVRRTTYVEIGGFDAVQFPMPMIEDIELGMRLRKKGKARLDPALHVTHLKKWTLRSVISTDIKNRAIPWTRLILATGEMPNDLNLRLGQRVAAALAPLVLGGLAAAPALFLTGQIPLGVAAVTPAAVSAVMHGEMIGWCNKTRGPSFAARFWLFHQVHLVYSAATYVWCNVEHRLRPRQLKTESP